MIRDLNNIDDDIVRVKRNIKEILYNDPDVIESLNNPTLDPECPSDALGRNILSYIRLPGTQDQVENYICFDIGDTRESYVNEKMKNQVIVFMCFVHEKNLETNFDIDRHDLLAYLVRDLINYRDYLGNGTQYKLFYNNADIIDVKWHVRTLKFKATTPNNLMSGGRNKHEIIHH